MSRRQSFHWILIRTASEIILPVQARTSLAEQDCTAGSMPCLQEPSQSALNQANPALAVSCRDGRRLDRSCEVCGRGSPRLAWTQLSHKPEFQ